MQTSAPMSKWPLRGILCVLGGFLLELMLGSYYTFGNIMPYLVSYMRVENNATVTYSQFATVQFVYGLTGGLTQVLAALLVIPFLGNRWTCAIGCILYTAGPILTRFALDVDYRLVIFTYGIVQGCGDMMLVVMYTVPQNWFPHHRGVATGLVSAGYGLSSFIMNPIQLALTNPNNVAAVELDGGDDKYFVDRDVIDRVPTLLYSQAVIFGTVMIIGFLMISEPPRVEEDTPREEQGTSRERGLSEMRKPSANEKTPIAHGKSMPMKTLTPTPTSTTTPTLLLLLQQAKQWFTNFGRHVLVHREFYMIFYNRLSCNLVAAAISTYYKTFALIFIDSDRFLTTYVGTISGIFNCLSRVVYGIFYDLLSYKIMASFQMLCLALLAGTLYFTSELGKVALMLWIFGIYFSFPPGFIMAPAKSVQVFGDDYGRQVIGVSSLGALIINPLVDMAGRLLLNGFKIDYLHFFLFIASVPAVAFLATLFFMPTSPEERQQIQNSKKMLCCS